MAKLSTFIIVMVAFIMILAGSFATLMAEMNSKYGSHDYNSSKIDIYNKLDSISNSSESIKNSSLSLQSRSGILDIIGGFFESAYNGMKIAGNSFSIFMSMKDQAIEDSGISNANLFNAGITIIVIIIIFLGIIISTALKRDV